MLAAQLEPNSTDCATYRSAEHGCSTATGPRPSHLEDLNRDHRHSVSVLRRVDGGVQVLAWSRPARECAARAVLWTCGKDGPYLSLDPGRGECNGPSTAVPLCDELAEVSVGASSLRCERVPAGGFACLPSTAAGLAPADGGVSLVCSRASSTDGGRECWVRPRRDPQPARPR